MRPPTPIAVLAVAFGILSLIPWLRFGGDWVSLLSRDLDHCEIAACDFIVVYLPQARLVLEGNPAVIEEWLNPPLLALVLTPFAWLPTPVAVGLWMALQGGAMAALALQCRRVLLQSEGITSWCATLLGLGLVLTSLPVIHSVKWGQVSLFIVVASIAALRGSGWKTGLTLGFLGALKVYPLTWVLLPLLRKRVGETLAAGAFAVLLGVGVPVVVLGWNQTWRFLESVLHARDILVSTSGGQALVPSFTRWFIDGSHTNWSLTTDPLLFPLPQADTVLGPLLAAGVIGATLWVLWRRCRDPALSTALVLLATSLAQLPGWHHYFAFLPWTQALILGWDRGRSWPSICAMASAALCALPLLCLEDWEPAYDAYSAWGGTTVAAILAWAGCMRIAFMQSLAGKVPPVGGPRPEDAQVLASASDVH